MKIKSTEVSSGLLMYDYDENKNLVVMLCHSGGPYFTNEIKHPRSWGIAKGRVESNESLIDAAIREFKEETGLLPIGSYISLGNVVYKNGKIVHAFAFKGRYLGKIHSNNFSVEWPPRSGNFQDFPEIDKASVFTIEEAKTKIMVSQEPFLDKLVEILK